MLRDNDTVECQKFFGGVKSVPKHKLKFRASVYAVIIRNGRLLVVENKLVKDKYALPGGSIERGETTYETLKREVKEEAGIEIQIERFLRFEQVFFYFDPLDEAYHGLLFYYLCSPVTSNLMDGWHAEEEIEGNPKWVNIADLSPDNLFNGDTVIELLQELGEKTYGPNRQGSLDSAANRER